MSEHLGNIGQMYENRNNKKKGKLLSCDEKCKTMTFEGEDGKSFVISNASFKSNWRKVQTETPVAIPVEEVKPVETPVTEVEALANLTEDTEVTNAEEVKPANKVKAGITNEERMEKKIAFRKECETKVQALIDSLPEGFYNMNVNVSKNRVELKTDHKAVIHLYLSYLSDKYRIFMKQDMFKAVTWSEGTGIIPKDVVIFDEYVLDASMYIKGSAIDSFFADVKPVLEAMCADITEARKKSEALKESKAKRNAKKEGTN